MNRSLFRITAYLQLGLAVLLSTGCAPTQPFFLHESPDLQHYLNTATKIEYPDVDVEHLAETVHSARPLTIGNHDYQFWDLSLEECVSIAIQNAKFFITTSGNAEVRQNVAAQITSGTPDQFGSIYDVAVQQATTQSIPLTVDGAGNRVLPRGVLRANQIGGVEDALAEFDAQFSAFVNYAKTDRPVNTVASTVTTPFNKQTDTTQQSAISKRFATGGVATLRQQLIYARSNTPLRDPANPATGLRATASDWTSILEAQYQHPLMRNRGTLVNRIPVVLASLNEDISIADFEGQVRNLVRDVENAYWDLYIAYRNVSTRIIGRNSAIVTARFAAANMKAGLGTRHDMAQAVEQYYQFRGQLETSLAGSNVLGDDQFGVYGRERVLREKLGLAATDGRLIRPIDEPTVARLEFDWDEAVAQMLYLSPELRRGKIRVKQSELELISAKNQILPEVNVSFNYRWVGVGDHLGPPERGASIQTGGFIGSSALAEQTSGNFQEGGVRLEITPPAFGARRELTRIRGAQLRLAREKGFLQEQERLLVHQLSDAFGKFASHFQAIKTNAQRWQAAEEEVESRLVSYRGGRDNINTVLQSQLRRAEAQIAYYRALAEYTKSINYIDYLKGTMLANSNITLAEGPWNKKAYWDALERARERSAGKQLQYGVTRPGVVRRGPVAGAEAAPAIIGNGAASFGETLPPTEFDDPAAGLNLEPSLDAIDMSDKQAPLTEMGSPAEILSPDIKIGPIVEPIAPGVAEPIGPGTAEPIGPGNAEPLGPGDSGTGSIDEAPMPSPRDAIPETEARRGGVRNVQPASHQTEAEPSYAPRPVRRKPIPSAP